MPDDTAAMIVAAIDGAEEVNDPLNGLVEKSAADPGAPFLPETLEALVALKKKDRAAFELLRSKLKKSYCRVTRSTRPSLRKAGILASADQSSPTS